MRKLIAVLFGALTIISFIASIVFPFALIATAFFAYLTVSSLPAPEPDTPENMYRPRESSVTEDDPDWREKFLLACESPAETAFLEAMIDGYGLKPDNGILVAPDIELDMQINYKPYRLDFLVNKWLVVEIDGAAWHSSPEAVERDRMRDEFFKGKGFSVLRIPAKVVFNTPRRAVEMVRAAIAQGRQPQMIAVKSPPKSVAKTFKDSAKSVGKFLDDFDANVTKASAIQEAMGPSRQTFADEQLVIGSALEAAKRKVNLEARLDADPNLREHYDAAHAELEELMESTRSAQPSTRTTIDISPMSWPPTHADRDIGTAILESYFALTRDRKRCFDDAREQLSKDPRLAPHVQSHLESLGCQAVWTEISKKKEPSVFDMFSKEIDGKGGGSS